MVDKKYLFGAFLLMFSIFFAGIASASFTIGNLSSSFGSVYGESSSVGGWINISFSSEPINSTLSSSTGNSISLGDLLNQNINSGYQYTCSTTGCGTDYSASNPSATETLTMNPGDSQIYGIKLTGSIANINSIDFKLTSDAGPSCLSQVNVDFLDDGYLDAINPSSSGSNTCTNMKDYGCFNPNLVTDQPQIVTQPLCELVNLSVSPGFFIGAWMQKISGSETVNASLYTTDGVKRAECTLPDASSNGGENSCMVNYSITQPMQAYVCIRNVSSTANANYVTQGYSSGNGCGFSGTPVSTASAAYPIFAQGQQFGNVGTIDLNSTMNVSSQIGTTFAQMATSYISSTYNPQMNCTNGCIIPIRIDSNAQQTVTLSNLQVNYKTNIGQITANNFYSLSATPPKISSGFQQLYIDNAGFLSPSTLGNYTFSLTLDGLNAASQAIQVADVPNIRLVTPLKTAYAYPTSFNVTADSTVNISSYSWDFGDNSSAITQGSMATHTYSNPGVYNLVINITSINNLSSSKTFIINVTSPGGLIAAQLNDMQRAVSVLQSEVGTFTAFQQQALNSSLNLASISSQLSALNSQFSNASSYNDYNSIVGGLVSIKIPDSIYNTATASDIPFVQDANSINLNTLQEIGGGNYTYGMDQAYDDAINSWQQQNINANLNYDEFSGSYSGYLDPVVKVFTMTITPQKDIPYDYYLVLPQMGGFGSDSNFSTKDNYIYIDMKGKTSVSFYTTDNVDVTNLPAFISPAISQLDLSTTTAEAPFLSKWLIFAAIIAGILVVVIVIYLLLRRWYDKRYENYLFKNKNDLYNMVNYVNNAKSKGMGNNDIEQNLKKSGWSSERIRYVMRKYAGKRTGLI